MSLVSNQPETEYAFIALGSNLGDSIRIIRRAFERLERLSHVPLLRSSLWGSDPIDCPPNSPRFINAVAGLVPIAEESSETLLAKLQALEKEFGRKPKVVLNEARPLDLDLISFRSEARNSSDLILPHPRAHLRGFVLQPLCEIAPDFRLPGQKLTVRELNQALPPQGRLERVEAPAENCQKN